mmetsp:Transcript_90521/g.264907  ORF Transcript_90521/g.264907 Transcript_90521/m.264907 type:complete len:146 (-) Transcript_90521:277-714(-)
MHLAKLQALRTYMKLTLGSVTNLQAPLRLPMQGDPQALVIRPLLLRQTMPTPSSSELACAYRASHLRKHILRDLDVLVAQATGMTCFGVSEVHILALGQVTWWQTAPIQAFTVSGGHFISKEHCCESRKTQHPRFTVVHDPFPNS